MSPRNCPGWNLEARGAAHHPSIRTTFHNAGRTLEAVSMHKDVLLMAPNDAYFHHCHCPLTLPDKYDRHKRSTGIDRTSSQQHNPT